MQRAKGTSYAGQLTFPGGAFEESDSCIKMAALRETFEEIPGLRNHGIDILDMEFPFMSEEYYKYDIRGHLAELQTDVELTSLDYNHSEVSNLQFLDFDTLSDQTRIKMVRYKGEPHKAATSMNGVNVPVYDLRGTYSTGTAVSSLFGWQAHYLNFTLHNLFPEKHP